MQINEREIQLAMHFKSLYTKKFFPLLDQDVLDTTLRKIKLRSRKSIFKLTVASSMVTGALRGTLVRPPAKSVTDPFKISLIFLCPQFFFGTFYDFLANGFRMRRPPRLNYLATHFLFTQMVQIGKKIAGCS